MVKDILLQYAKYNYWANNRLAQSLLKIDENVLDRPTESSFSTLRKTVYHIWDAETIWLDRLTDISLDSWPSKQHGDDQPIDLFLNKSLEIVDFVSERDEDYFFKQCSYKNIAGRDYTQRNHEVIMHCVNHSTYHRAQLVTIMRFFGIKEVPSTDFIAFLRERESDQVG